MKINWNDNEGSGHVAEILPFADRHSGIDIFRKRKWGTNQWEAVFVNWSACGNVSVADAMLFIAALEKAIEIAENEQASWETEQA